MASGRGRAETRAVSAENRLAWDSWSDTYQGRHGSSLAGRLAEAWGLWRLPERDVRLLGSVEGLSILELGCGAARFGASLAGRGAARVWALDISRAQLQHAAEAVADAPGVFLIQGDAESIPLAAACVDLVISDYGGMSWGAPERTIPEVSRVLAPGGRIVFCTHSPWFVACLDDQGVLQRGLQRPYFGMRTRSVRRVATDYQIPYGEWIDLLRRAGLTVQRLVEVRPDERAQTTFSDRPVDWAARWPAENIWIAEKCRP